MTRGKKQRNLAGKAVSVLKKGGIVIYPTETLYGLGASIKNRKAVEKIYRIKGREKTKALSIACLKEDIEKYACVDGLAKFLIANFLPGPVTLVLKKKKTVPKWITKSSYVGIRVPENKTAQEIIKKLGCPITSTSANISGKKEPASAKKINKKIKDEADLVIDEGETKYKGPSTVLQINGGIKILRHGALDIWTKECIC